MNKITTEYIGVKLYGKVVRLIAKYTKFEMEYLFPRKSLSNFIHSDITYIKSLFLGLNNE